MEPEVEQRIIALVSYMNYNKRLARSIRPRHSQDSWSVNPALTNEDQILRFDEPKTGRPVVVNVSSSDTDFFASSAFEVQYDNSSSYVVDCRVSGSTVKAESSSTGNRYDATVSGSTVTLRSNSGESIVFDVY